MIVSITTKIPGPAIYYKCIISFWCKIDFARHTKLICNNGFRTDSE